MRTEPRNRNSVRICEGMSAIMPVTVLLSFRLILILQTIFAKGANLLFKNTDHINNGIKSAIIAYLVFHTFIKFKGEVLPKGLIGLYDS
jgi:hypothetical protein